MRTLIILALLLLTSITAMAQAPVYSTDDTNFESQYMHTNATVINPIEVSNDSISSSAVDITAVTNAQSTNITSADGHIKDELEKLRSEVQDLRQQLQTSRSSGGYLASSSSGQQALQNSDNVRVASAAGDASKEQIYYDVAYNLVVKKDYQKAQQALTSFIDMYPNGKLSPNAWYWLGEVHLIQHDLQSAATSFEVVGKSFPNSIKAPDALYKLADTKRLQGNKVAARELYARVIGIFPGTSASSLAQNALRANNF